MAGDGPIRCLPFDVFIRVKGEYSPEARSSFVRTTSPPFLVAGQNGNYNCNVKDLKILWCWLSQIKVNKEIDHEQR